MWDAVLTAEEVLFWSHKHECMGTRDPWTHRMKYLLAVYLGGKSNKIEFLTSCSSAFSVLLAILFCTLPWFCSSINWNNLETAIILMLQCWSTSMMMLNGICQRGLYRWKFELTYLVSISGSYYFLRVGFQRLKKNQRRFTLMFLWSHDEKFLIK